MAINKVTVNAMINNVKRRRFRLAKTPVPPEPGLSFNMTAAHYAGTYAGYSSGTMLDPFGSIDREPIPANPIIVVFCFLTDNTVLQIVFTGDIQDQLAGKQLYVDGVPYTTGVAYIDGLGTIAEASEFEIKFTDGQLVNIELRG
jgi:hypothetical protein